MALCPFATQRPVSSHGGAEGAILGAVIHVTAGEGDPYNEFANPANQVSSHFGIGNGQGGMPDGELEQYVDTALMSWAQAAGNANYISIETEGEPTEPLTAKQVATFAQLYAWLHAEHGIPFAIVDTPGARGFILHSDGGAAWGGHPCPGALRAAQRQLILTLAVPVAPSGTTSEGDAVGWTVYDDESGGYWATDLNGDLRTGKGAPFIGALSQHPQWQAGLAESAGKNPCVGMDKWKDPDGHIGIVFVTRANGNQDQSGLEFYHFRRNGQPA